MSLTFTMYTPDCMLIASDGRTTIFTNKTDENGKDQVESVFYRDHSQKMVVFNDRLVVTTTGASRTIDGRATGTFLQDLKESLESKNLAPKDLAEIIFKECKEKFSNDNGVVFMVSGYLEHDSYVYRIDSDKEEIEECCHNEFGASWSGSAGTLIKSMFDTVTNWRRLTPQDVIEVGTTIMDSIVTLFKYQELQCVGGNVDIYIMFRNKENNSGWIRCSQAISTLKYNQGKELAQNVT